MTRTATAHDPDPAPSYWYPRDGWGEAASLDAVRRFLRADEAMRRKLQRDMDMNETDLRAVRYLAAAEKDGRAVAPRDLSRALGISTASTTKLLDRLEAGGRLRRVQHPTDRRGLRIELTSHVHTEVHETLGSMHARMREVAAALQPAESAVVVAFLDALADAVRPDPAKAEDAGEPTAAGEPAAAGEPDAAGATSSGRTAGTPEVSDPGSAGRPGSRPGRRAAGR
ncbi:MarR family winged helix-turn-helix transcriptional regulator [Luteimicrobium sp. NPDC057192]|uniref:MarR family winged helix-turn-helix transcriptional regulator n=1 Tax=Luteimicrobium sp. NPDC057192 TaxID=3346042 RepID=UPI00363FA42F